MVKTTSHASCVGGRVGVLPLLLVFTHSALKPETPPMIKNRPFSIFWATPTMQCQHFFNVDLNLQLFNMLSNPLETQSGSTTAIFLQMN